MQTVRVIQDSNFFFFSAKHADERIDPSLLFDYSTVTAWFRRCTNRSPGHMTLNSGMDSSEVIASAT